jgi:hypothetical protein
MERSMPMANKSHAVFGIAAILVLAGNAQAESPAALAWVQDPDSIIRVDGSDAGTSANFYSFSRLIHSSGGPGPILIFNCQAMSTGQHSLNAAVQLDPDNAYEENPSERLHLLNVSVTLTIGGSKKSERFKYHPASSKIIPHNKAVAKQLYNAVVQGSDVSLKVKGKTYDLAFPGKDPVFVSFAKTCPTTNGGKFDPAIVEQAGIAATADPN